jgi:hypothetical protein
LQPRGGSRLEVAADQRVSAELFDLDSRQRRRPIANSIDDAEKPEGLALSGVELMHAPWGNVHAVMLGHCSHGVVEQDGAASVQDEDDVSVMVAFEGRVAAGIDLEVTNRAGELRVLRVSSEEGLSRDSAEAGCARFVLSDVDIEPTALSGCPNHT